MSKIPIISMKESEKTILASSSNNFQIELILSIGADDYPDLIEISKYLAKQFGSQAILTENNISKYFNKNTLPFIARYNNDIIGYIELLPTINNFVEKKKVIDRIIKESNEKMRLEIQSFENDNSLIPEHILNQFKFWLQVEKAQRRKLITRIANTDLTHEEAVKEDLIISVFQRLQNEIEFSDSIDSNKA